MREKVRRSGASRANDAARAENSALWLRVLREHPRELLTSTLMAAAATTIIVNALFLQSGPHPAPIFANKPPPPPVVVQAPAAPPPPARAAEPQRQASDALQLPRPKPAELRPETPARPRNETIADIQRELAKRGFYEGPEDGIYGPKTDAAIRDFEQAAGLRPSAEPTDVLLQTLTRSTVKAKAPPAPPRRDPIAELLGPNRKVVAIQRALSDYGYGQFKPDGQVGPETRAAIELFERDRKLPVTGQITDRLTRELSAVTGRPLD